jgi:hypothetical protein
MCEQGQDNIKVYQSDSQKYFKNDGYLILQAKIHLCTKSFSHEVATEFPKGETIPTNIHNTHACYYYSFFIH